MLARVAPWLERWNAATAVPGTVDEVLLERELLRPAAALAPLLPEGDRYEAWLRQRAERWDGSPIPLVAAHHDLTMTNVLLTPSGGIGVVDWASARERSLPLVDLAYAMADATAAATGYLDRAAAFAGADAPSSFWSCTRRGPPPHSA